MNKALSKLTGLGMPETQYIVYELSTIDRQWIFLMVVAILLH